MDHSFDAYLTKPRTLLLELHGTWRRAGIARAARASMFRAAVIRVRHTADGERTGKSNDLPRKLKRHFSPHESNEQAGLSR
jgi:hypothetical protein